MKELYSLLPGQPDFDETVYRLGSLCKRGHDWRNTGFSLRYINGGGCADCAIDKRRRQVTEKPRFESLVCKLNQLDLAELNELVEYSSRSPSGLYWKRVTEGRRRKGIRPGDIAGYRSRSGYLLRIGEAVYETSHLVLILHGKWPKEGQVAAKIDPAGADYDANNLEWAQRGLTRTRNLRAKITQKLNQTPGSLDLRLPDGCTIGTLCRRRHRWRELELSLRTTADGKCVECERIRKQSPQSKATFEKWKSRNRESINKKAREKAAELRKDPAFRALANERNRLAAAARRAKQGRQSRAKGLEDLILPPGYALDLVRARICRQLLSEGNPRNIEALIPLIEQRFELETLLGQAIKAAGKSPTVPQLVEAEQRLYWKNNPNSYREFCRERAKNRAKWRHMTDPEYRLYHRQKSKRRKAIIKHIIGNQLTGKQVLQRFAQFDHCCAYCGMSGEDLHIEHVIPISQGGTHALGNIVPACKHCNFSKSANEVEAWFRSQEFFTERRWKKIRRVLGWDKCGDGQLSLL